MRHFTRETNPPFSFDLHVLGTPPAFILSQDQTLQFNPAPYTLPKSVARKTKTNQTQLPHYLVFKEQVCATVELCLLLQPKFFCQELFSKATN